MYKESLAVEKLGTKWFVMYYGYDVSCAVIAIYDTREQGLAFIEQVSV